MKLVIVESPAKCKTIEKYLGEDFNVVASLGHIRDLATSGKGGLGVDTENDFKPTYIINKDKRKIVSELKKLKSESSEVILATDPDREGEAIAWHLAQVLNLDVDNTKRLEFHEITKESIIEAMNNAREININLVSSQETRRILDRVIGFKLSNLLFKKIKSRSAGRVQSATLKLIYDHEKEIETFVPEEYYSISLKIKIDNQEQSLDILDLSRKSIEIKTKEQCDEILNNIPSTLTVTSLDTSFREKESKEAFTTSTMQQEAFAKLKYKTKKTQSIAQQLYEGIDLKDEHVGLITYMRTDSTRLSPVFLEKAESYITEKFGKEYLGHFKKGKKNEMMQDAHEAIRPTSCYRTPESVRPFLTVEQYNLYKLIYNRALASLMSPKKEQVLTVSFKTDKNIYKFDAVKTVFKGYESLYLDDSVSNEFKGNLPDINIGDEFEVTCKTGEQKFTNPPSHYSEAKIVKLMEEVGIGRPSTYATTIETLRERKYILNNAGILTITDQGKKTAHVLEKFFPQIVDVKYTAQMENKLDNVEDGSQSRTEMLTNFYVPFMEDLEKAKIDMYEDEDVPTGELCPICGSPLVFKEGKNGQFIGCSNYPKCKYVKKEKKEEKQTGETCPICGKPLIEKQDKRGKTFVACSGFPDCKYIKPDIAKESGTQITKKCPKCGSDLVKKKGKFGYFLGCSNYPNCNYMEKIFKKKQK